MIEQELHRVANNIVKDAVKTKSVIVLGNLKGIRKSITNKGKRLNRIVSNMPYYKLTTFITYKALEYRIRIVKIKETNTSKMCSRCNKIGQRKSQGLFVCKACNYQINADYNASRNILRMSFDYMSSDRAYGLRPKITPEVISPQIKSL